MGNGGNGIENHSLILQVCIYIYMYIIDLQ